MKTEFANKLLTKILDERIAKEIQKTEAQNKFNKDFENWLLKNTNRFNDKNQLIVENARDITTEVKTNNFQKCLKEFCELNGFKLELNAEKYKDDYATGFTLYLN